MKYGVTSISHNSKPILLPLVLTPGIIRAMSDCPSSQYHRCGSVTLEFIIQPMELRRLLMNVAPESIEKRQL